MATTCRGCGKPIVWAIVEGKRIPLDPRPAVYMLTSAEPDATGTVTAVRHLKAMVGHHTTCPNVGDFSGSKKKAAP